MTTGLVIYLLLGILWTLIRIQGESWFSMYSRREVPLGGLLVIAVGTLILWPIEMVFAYLTHLFTPIPQ